MKGLVINMTIVENYLCSLLAKPFVILTGSSGTGKTRLAIQFAEAIDKKVIITMTSEIIVNKVGKILNKTEDEVRVLCEGSNLFEAVILGNEKENVYPIKLTMCTHAESEDKTFMSLIDGENESTIHISKIVNEDRREKNYELVPVGADWTDVRYLLGYANPFGEDGKKTYEITNTLKIILRALHPANKYKPHFLILDEMNLSHVERYFSAFLSVMEANKSTSEPMNLINKTELELICKVLQNNTETRTEIESAKALLEKNRGIFLPQNLFIIGTINVDETTYMFSPKVLDRAHVIELRSENPYDYFEQLKLDESNARISFNTSKANEILGFFQNSIKNRNIDNQNPLTLVKESIFDERQQKLILDGIQSVIHGIYILLEPCGFDYGYRIVNEVLEYVKYSIDVQTSDRWKEILDRAILQKVLPKIHGNRRQLGDCLKATYLFLGGQATSYVYGVKTISVEETNIQLINCQQKLKRWLKF